MVILFKVHFLPLNLYAWLCLPTSLRSRALITISSSRANAVRFDWQNLDMRIVAIVIALSGLVLGAPQLYPWINNALQVDPLTEIAESDQRADTLGIPGAQSDAPLSSEAQNQDTPPVGREVSQITIVSIFFSNFLIAYASRMIIKN